MQNQDFELSNIHNYFEIDEPFDSVKSLVIYLEDKLENDEYEHFYSNSNPNGSGNNVDVLIVSYQGNVIFEN